MKKIIILVLLFYILFIFNIYSNEKKTSIDLKEWKKIYWITSIGTSMYSISSSLLLFSVTIINYNTINHGFSFVFNNPYFLIIQLFAIDPINTIPIVGPYLTSTAYLVYGIALFSSWGLLLTRKYITDYNYNLFMNSVLPTGIFSFINFCVLLASGIIQTISAININKLKKKSKVSFNFNYTFSNNLKLIIGYKF